jgi:uncharacterized protein
MRPNRFPSLVVAILVLCLALSAAWAQLATFGKSELTVDTASGKQHFGIEEAKTSQQMMQGLMYRRSMPADAGMLFEYDHPQPVSFWMKNTLIPLDMLFVDQRGRIINIHERAVPGSLEPIAAAAPARAVIELNGGTAARLGIKPGDRVIFPIFGDAS